MPHCLLEYSSNIQEKPNLHQLFSELHEALAATGEFSVSDFKSRAICHDIYQIANGAKNRTFIALEICILDGRSDEIKNKISSIAMQILERCFMRTQEETDCSITTRISDIHRASYKKLKE
jgi:5-carboxymethyl-2-hydroxymuconate isomerase